MKRLMSCVLAVMLVAASVLPVSAGSDGVDLTAMTVGVVATAPVAYAMSTSETAAATMSGMFPKIGAAMAAVPYVTGALGVAVLFAIVMETTGLSQKWPCLKDPGGCPQPRGTIGNW